jgi:hypothetical protein
MSTLPATLTFDFGYLPRLIPIGLQLAHPRTSRETSFQEHIFFLLRLASSALIIWMLAATIYRLHNVRVPPGLRRGQYFACSLTRHASNLPAGLLLNHGTDAV